MKRSVLLFDLGGVLVDIAIFDALRALLGEALDDDAVRARWLRSPAVRSLELGWITPSVFASRFIEEWQVPLAPEAFLLDFFSWVKDP
jgi:glucose-1-phosphatase